MRKIIEVEVVYQYYRDSVNSQYLQAFVRPADRNRDYGYSFDKDWRHNLQYLTLLDVSNDKRINHYNEAYCYDPIGKISLKQVPEITRNLKILHKELHKLISVFGEPKTIGEAIQRFAVACKATHIIERTESFDTKIGQYIEHIQYIKNIPLHIDSQLFQKGYIQNNYKSEEL